MTTTFVTEKQSKHLKAALELTGSLGFMEDARAVAMYRTGKEGDEEEITAIAVYESFRGNRAEMHLGTAPGHRLTLEMLQGLVTLCFHPRWFNLDRVLARVPTENRNMIATLVKMGCEIEYRDRASVAGGGDAIVLSLDREEVLASAAPQTETAPASGE